MGPITTKEVPMGNQASERATVAYRLFYWRLRGRGEQVRLLLNELEQDYEDVYVGKDRDFPRLKEEGPGTLSFGSVPMLQDADFRLVQGPAIMNYLGRKHGIMPSDLQAAARTEAMVLGAEDMRMAYFRLLGEGERAAERRSKFVDDDWRNRWLPAWDGLLELNAGNGYLVGASLTQADVAVWDALDAIVTWIEGAAFGAFGRVERFYEDIRARPAIAAYLVSEARLGKKV
jgi:glutathione S-transferase